MNISRWLLTQVNVFDKILKMDIMKTIRDEISESPVSQRQISRDTDINPTALHRVMVRNGTLKAESCDKLWAYFGYELTKKRGSKNGNS